MIPRRNLWSLILPLLLFSGSLNAQVPPEPEDVSPQDREAQLFGEEAPSPDAEVPAEPAAAGEPVSAEDALFGSEEGIPLVVSDRLDAKLAEADDTLDIGGRAYLRLHQNFADSTDADDDRLSSPNLLDLYLDARRSEHLRFFARGRLSYNANAVEGSQGSYGQDIEPTRAVLDQFFLKFDVGRQLFVTAGKQPIKWGAGRFWNPTDFLHQQRRDPLAIFDERLGVALLKLHLPMESLGWNLYAVGNFENVQRAQEVGGALRLEMVMGPAEITLSGAVKRDDPLRLGADISTGIGPFDLWVEGAVVRHRDRSVWAGDFDLSALNPSTDGAVDPAAVDLGGISIPTEIIYGEDWVVQVVTGFEFAVRYSDQDSIYFGGEYFYNDGGYNDSGLYPWLMLQGQFDPFYLGQHYASGFMMLNQPGDWNDTRFFVSGISNISDGSYVSRFDYQVTVLTYLSLNFFAAYHFGQDGEFFMPLELPAVALTAEQAETYGLPDSVKAVVDDGSLAEGLHIPAPMIDLGLWLRMSF